MIIYYNLKPDNLIIKENDFQHCRTLILKAFVSQFSENELIIDKANIIAKIFH
jgi:hypothetical protein